jgi:hypothetical protein
MRGSVSTFGIAIATVDCVSKKVPEVANLRDPLPALGGV